MKVRELMGVLEQNYILNGRASLKNARYQWKPVLRLLGETEAEAVTTGGIEKYRATRVAEGAARSTVNNEMALLRRAYNLGLLQELLTRKPHFETFRVCNARQGFVRPETFWQIFRCLQVLDSDVADASMCAYMLGWRRRMVLEMVWDEVDLKAGLVQLPQRRVKNRRVMTVMLEGDLIDLFKRRSERRNGPFVFHREGKPIKDFRGVWKRVRKAVGIPDLRLHDYRRSYAMNAFAAGIPVNQIMAFGGWATMSMVLRYAIPDVEAMRKSLRKLGDYVRRGNGGRDVWLPRGA